MLPLIHDCKSDLYSQIVDISSLVISFAELYFKKCILIKNCNAPIQDFLRIFGKHLEVWKTFISIQICQAAEAV